MSRSCDICCKGVQHGNKVSKSYNHTKISWRPNLVSVKTVFSFLSMTVTDGTLRLSSELLVKKVRVPKTVAEVGKYK